MQKLACSRMGSALQSRGFSGGVCVALNSALRASRCACPQSKADLTLNYQHRPTPRLYARALRAQRHLAGQCCGL